MTFSKFGLALGVATFTLAGTLPGTLTGTGAADAQVLRRAEEPETVQEERSGSPEHEAHQAPPDMGEGVRRSEFEAEKFRPDPSHLDDKPYDVDEQIKIYGGKTPFDAPRPVLEWGYPQYSEGPIGAGHNIVGGKNLVRPQLLVYGDWRTAVAYNDNGDNEVGQIATRLNLDVDLKLTATERLHMFLRPLDQGGEFSRVEFFGPDENGGDLEVDGNLETLFFEGDIGAIQAGLTGEWASYDLPITFGLIPMFFQNGIWMDDAFIGGAFAIPAKNSPMLDISNMDFSFFAGFDKVSTNALKDADGTNADHAGRVFGVQSFIETREGYFEGGYGYLDDRRDTNAGFDYHNVMMAWTKRYGGWLSNSVRGIANFGQDPDDAATQTADGFALLLENSLITHKPVTLVPYFNFFAGIDRPQPLARGADGILKNTGINFETDGLTGFPKLDDTAQDAFGGAIGLEYLFDLSQQVVVEVASVQPYGGASETIEGDQYALGVRYQRNLDDRWIFRTDAMHGWLRNESDVAGIRFEIRRKF